jgi:hypothetical protein
MAYSLLVLLTDQTTLTLDTLAERLRKRFSYDPAVLIEHKTSDVVLVQWGAWSVHIIFENEPHVVVESEDIADRFAASHPSRSEIATSKQRLCVSGDDDPNMDHFNDFLFVMEVLESYSGVYLFDPLEGAFVDGSS